MSDVNQHLQDKDAFEKTTPARSPEWHKVERDFLSKNKNKTCAACGGAEKLQVHHVHPFHLHPELELDENNLITLCMQHEKECHLFIGHGDSWKAYNPNVLNDAETVLRDTTKRDEIITEAKKNKLLV
jgi:hypothetical protein